MISKLLGKIVYRFVWLIGAVVFYTPFCVKQKVAFALGALWFHVVRFRRKIILHNLILAFPRGSGETMNDYRTRLEALCRKNINHYCLAFIETLERPLWTREVVERRVTLCNEAEFFGLVKSNTGLFVLSSHIGNWELMTLVACKFGVRLAVLTKFLRNSFWDQIWVESRKDFGLELLSERNSGLQIARCIQKGKSVGFILDQHTGEPHGVESRFLGHKAWTAKGLAILSHRLKAPVVPAFLIRKDDGDYEIHFEKAFQSADVIPEKFCVESGPLSNEALEFHVTRCNEIMEKWSYKYPEQYLWLHKRFKNFFNYKNPLPW